MGPCCGQWAFARVQRQIIMSSAARPSFYMTSDEQRYAFLLVTYEVEPNGVAVFVDEKQSNIGNVMWFHLLLLSRNVGS